LAKILLVEDEIAAATVVRQWLEFEQHVVEHAESGLQATNMLRVSQYDMVILDLILPDGHGSMVVDFYRAAGGMAPILVVTVKGAISDKESVFDAGVDDYLTKPFELKELSLRIKALLRRGREPKPRILKLRDITLDPESHQITRAGTEVKLLPKEFALLEFFLRHPNKVFTVDDLLDSVWASDSGAGPAAVRTSIIRLRQKLDSDGQDSIITTVHRMGYKLAPQ
jgi:two-component system OmpR family response regulator